MSRRAAHIVPGDVSAADAAHRLGLDLRRFTDLLPDLLRRGFPSSDPTTGMYDLDAIDAWRRSRHAGLFSLTGPSGAVDARSGIVRRRIEERRNG